MAETDGLEAIVPNVSSLTEAAGVPQPYVANSDVTVFSVLDTGQGTVTSYLYDMRTPGEPARVIDVFTVGEDEWRSSSPRMPRGSTIAIYCGPVLPQ